MTVDTDKILVLATQVAQSRYFADLNQSQAVVKILAGQELGLHPIAAIRAIHVYKGNITLSATAMAALVRKSGYYDYNIKTSTKELCEIEAVRIIDGKRVILGVSHYTIEEARQAGLLSKENWQKYPLDMLFARTMSRLIKHFMPDLSVFPIYNPDEFDVKLNENGEPLYAEYTESATKVMPPQPKNNTPQIPKIEKITLDSIDTLYSEITGIANRTGADSDYVKQRVITWINRMWGATNSDDTDSVFAELNTMQFEKLIKNLPKLEKQLLTENESKNDDIQQPVAIDNATTLEATDNE